MSVQSLDIDLDIRDGELRFDPEQVRRGQRMVASMGRYLTLLTGRPVGTSLVGAGHAPAWSTSDHVTFVLQHLGDLTRPQDITAGKGLTLHEAAHILFSPRAGSPLVSWVHQVQTGSWPGFTDHVSEEFPGRETGASLLPVAQAYNILEDQRIETVLVGKFGAPVIPWLTAAATRHLLSDDDVLDFAHPFTWGRTYLPFALRTALRRRFASQGHAERMAQIIDFYRELNLETQLARARTLVYEFAALLAYSHRGPSQGCEEHRVDRHQPTPASPALSAGEQQQLFQRGRAIERQRLGEPAGSDAGADAEQIARAAQHDALASVAREARRDATVYRGGRELSTVSRPADLPLDAVQEVSATADALLGSSGFGRELEALRIEHEAAWERRTSGGRLNAGRYLRGAELDEAFDRWELGRDDTVDLDVVIALDCSGSMDGEPMQHAAQAMWALKRAVDRVGGACTVLGFNHESCTIYSADERSALTVREPRAEGGTDPYTALAHAERLLVSTERALRLLVVITDGAWFEPERSDEIIESLRDEGVLTAMVALGDRALSSHGCEVRQEASSASALFALGRDIVRTAVRRNLLERVAA